MDPLSVFHIGVYLFISVAILRTFERKHMVNISKFINKFEDTKVDNNMKGIIYPSYNHYKQRERMEAAQELNVEQKRCALEIVYSKMTIKIKEHIICIPIASRSTTEL